MPSQLTIRGVSPELNRRLNSLGKSTGQSVNSLVLRILEEAAGIDARRERLDRYRTWSPQELAEFDSALKSQRVVDDDLWR